MAINAVLVVVLSLPCVFGFNVLRASPFPASATSSQIEDFIVSNNMLPLGALIFVLFCTQRFGWGWKSSPKPTRVRA
ncbi:MAG: hypothetical protein ACLTQI_03265 [Slackia sp.]